LFVYKLARWIAAIFEVERFLDNLTGLSRKGIEDIKYLPGAHLIVGQVNQA